MTINEIYSWLIEHEPENSDPETRMVWGNMASYCYFINTMDFDHMFQDKLKVILDKSVKYDIAVPDGNHDKVIKLAQVMSTGEIDSCINELLYD